MSNLLSFHGIPRHMRGSDEEYVRQLRPRVVKLIDVDANIVTRYRNVAPDALFFLRDHAMSEQHDDVTHAPEETGQRHAREWSERIHSFGLPLSQIVIPGINEPRVWSELDQVVRYYVAFLDACAGYGMRAAALNLSVGWPANDGPDLPPNWEPYEPVHQAILRGDHVLCVHEYFDHRGPSFNWGWWCGRIFVNTWDVPIIIGEAGLDEYVGNPSVGQYNRGWMAHMDQVTYANAIEEYCQRIHADSRIIGICPFTTDYGSDDWKSFDTEPVHQYLTSIYVEAGTGKLPAPPVVEPPPVEPPPVEPPVQPPPVTKPGLVHPCPGAVLTQHWGENGDYYKQFGAWGHNGTDLGAPQGTPVLAIADGTVMMVDVDADYGNYVRIYHPRLKCHSFYAHLSAVAVVVGAKVVAGQRIGAIGSTGNSTGPHLHFEIRLGKSTTYSPNAPMANGRCDPETFYAIRDKKL